MSHDEPPPPSDAERIHAASIASLLAGPFGLIFALGDASLVDLTLILAGAAVIVGVIGLMQARGGLRGNRLMSAAGLVLGLVSLLVLGLRLWLTAT